MLLWVALRRSAELEKQAKTAAAHLEQLEKVTR